VIAPRVKVDLGVNRSAHEVAAVTAHEIISFALLLQAELEHEAVFAS
jgi:hypothetical protein